MSSYVFTSESVSEGHPDKVCDQISDSIVDIFLSREPEARVAVETMEAAGSIGVVAANSGNAAVAMAAVSMGGGGSSAGASRSERAAKVQEARMKGYEGDSCPECMNFTLVRNGTCLKCDTCGSTTGCS